MGCLPSINWWFGFRWPIHCRILCSPGTTMFFSDHLPSGNRFTMISMAQIVSQLHQPKIVQHKTSPTPTHLLKISPVTLEIGLDLSVIDSKHVFFSRSPGVTNVQRLTPPQASTVWWAPNGSCRVFWRAHAPTTRAWTSTMDISGTSNWGYLAYISYIYIMLLIRPYKVQFSGLCTDIPTQNIASYDTVAPFWGPLNGHRVLFILRRFPLDEFDHDLTSLNPSREWWVVLFLESSHKFWLVKNYIIIRIIPPIH